MEIVAIDGPGGVGKTSVSRLVAERRGAFFLSSGQIYRCMAWYMLQQGWLPDEPVDAARLQHFVLGIDREGHFLVNGAAVPPGLHSEEISQATSLISAEPQVRDRANEAQREAARQVAREGAFPGMVIEGRDIGTVVFPDTPYKFFLTASDAIRAERRFRELSATEPGVTLESVLEALRERDRRDRTRDVAPLVPARDAIEIDTTGHTLEQVVAEILGHMPPPRP